MKFVEYVKLDAKDGTPSTDYPTRHGSVDPVDVVQILKATNERIENDAYPNGYDHTIYVAAVDGNIDVPGVIKELDSIEVDTLKEQIRAGKLEDLNHSYANATGILEAGYPASERESWHIQVSESRALELSAEARTPWLSAAAATRGIDRDDLAALVIAQDDVYRIAHGTLTGVRQSKRDVISAEQNIVTLSLIDTQIDASILSSD